MDNSKNKPKVSDLISKVEEPTVVYKIEDKIYENIEHHPLFSEVIEKSIKEAEEGKLISHDEVMKRRKEKFLFFK